MDTTKALFWHQGLFLQPQHFQHLDLSWDQRLVPYRQWMMPHFWGVHRIDVKKAALGIRSFGLIHGSFLFSDGTHVELPGNAVVEDRSFDEAWIEGGKPFTVYLGLRKWNADGENVTVVKKGDSLADVSTRYIASADPEERRDLHAGGPMGHVKTLTHLLKIFWESEKDHLGDYLLIPVAQLDRLGSSIVLSDQFVPPSLSIAASDTLVKRVKDTEDLLASRGRQLEEHKSQRGIHTAEFGSRDMVYLLALRSLNRSLPSLRHYVEAPQVHPWLVYGVLRQIIGDLSCFSERMNVMGDSSKDGTDALPSYDPLDLANCFGIAQRLIIQLLDEITAGPDYVVALPPSDGLYMADIKPIVFDGANRFYLAITTEEDSAKTLQTMAALAKLSSRNQMGILISHSLPGIPLKYLAVPPQELPRRRDVLYFAIDSHHEQWAMVQKERAIALAWDGTPEQFKVELMAVTR